MLFLSAVLSLRPVFALAGNEQSAGQENTEDESVGVAFQGVPYKLVEEQDGQHDQQQQEVGHILRPAGDEGEHHAAAHLQRADDLTKQDRADPNLFQSWQCLGVALVRPFLEGRRGLFLDISHLSEVTQTSMGCLLMGSTEGLCEVTIPKC